jgi:hypothetical protein
VADDIVEDGNESDSEILQRLLSDLENVNIKQSCYGTSYLRFSIKSQPTLDLSFYLKNCKMRVLQIITRLIRLKFIISIQLMLEVLYIKNDEVDEKGRVVTKNKTRFHKSAFEQLDIGDDINEYYQRQEKVINECHEYCSFEESNWLISEIVELNLTTLNYSPFKGGRYIETPEKLKNSRSLLNIENRDDDFCFLWCTYAYLHPKSTNKSRVSHYRHYLNSEELNIDGLNFPLDLCDIKIFENLNKDFSFNVFMWDHKHSLINLIRKSKKKKKHHINLLLLKKSSRFHYVLITNLKALVKPQITTHGGSNYICEECFVGFSKKAQFLNHIMRPNCSEKILKFPKEGENILKFREHFKSLELKFTIYADFECILQKYNDLQNKIIHKHIPSMYAYVIKAHETFEEDDYLKEIRLYSGVDCSQHFVNSIRKDAIYIHQTYLTKMKKKWKLSLPLKTSILKILTDVSIVIFLSMKILQSRLEIIHTSLESIGLLSVQIVTLNLKNLFSLHACFTTLLMINMLSLNNSQLWIMMILSKFLVKQANLSFHSATLYVTYQILIKNKR